MSSGQIFDDLGRYLNTVTSMLKSRTLTHTPFFLAHAVTFGCNSRCKSCTYWKLTPRMKEDLDINGVKDLLDMAYSAGIRGYYMFGGEPLVRRDIGEIVDYAKNSGFVTVMNTNGSFLEKKAPELQNLDFAFVSVDYYNSYDDIIRGRPGNFKEAMDGINRIRTENKTKVALVTTISELNWNAIAPMAALARDLGVGISFNSVEQSMDFGLTTEETTPNFDIGLSDDKLLQFYEILLRLKTEGYPLLETEHVLRDYVQNRRWKCQFPKMFVYVTPDMKIYSCNYSYHYDLKKGSFQDYFGSEKYRTYTKLAEGCNRCIRTCVRGYSYTYDMVPKQIVGMAGQARNLFNRR